MTVVPGDQASPRMFINVHGDKYSDGDDRCWLANPSPRPHNREVTPISSGDAPKKRFLGQGHNPEVITLITPGSPTIVVSVYNIIL